MALAISGSIGCSTSGSCTDMRWRRRATGIDLDQRRSWRLRQIRVPYRILQRAVALARPPHAVDRRDDFTLGQWRAAADRVPAEQELLDHTRIDTVPQQSAR